MPKEILAHAIVRIGKAMKQLSESGMNKRAIVVLLHDAVPNGARGGKYVNKGQIEAVLDAMEELREKYCK